MRQKSLTFAEKYVMAKAGYIFMCMDEESDIYRRSISWMRDHGCTRIVQESPEDEALRPQWKKLLGCLGRNDEIVLTSFANALRGPLELCYFLEVCRINVIRVISIEDKIDSKDELFDCKTSDVLHVLESLPFNIGLIKNAAQRLVDEKHDPTEVKQSQKAKRDRDSMIINMYNNGFSIDEIWQNSGMKSRSSVFNVLKRYKIPLRRDTTKPERTKSKSKLSQEPQME